MLELKNLSKKFKNTTACRDISFKVNTGEFFVLLGPSGCGKTTILRSIAGLEIPDRGRIFLNKRNITGLSPQQRNTAMVFQDYALYPNMTVRKNLEFPLKMHKTPKSMRTKIAEKTARLLQINNLLDKKAVKLSGGQQQRVAVGRALVRKPEIFLLDEPLSNLDAKLRQHLRVELARIHKDLNITMIYVTHDQGEAMTLGERIAVIKDGSIHQIGPPEEIYNRPGDLFTAKFIGFPEINVFEVSVKNKKIDMPGGPLTAHKIPPGFSGKIIAAIRPEDIKITDKGEGIEADLEIREVSGPDTVLYLRVKGSPVRVRASKNEAARIKDSSSKINISFDPSKLLFFDPENKKSVK